MSKIDPKFIVDLKGKQFVTYEGLLDLAHQEGLIGITTELIQIPSEINNYLAIVQAKATTKDKSFMGIGDCDNKSANSMIAPHKIRMAETRAKARALRDLTNVGMTAIEELGEDGESSPIATNSNPVTNTQVKGKLSDKQIARLYAISSAAGITAEQVKSKIKSQLNKEVSEMTKEEYDTVCKYYEGLKK